MNVKLSLNFTFFVKYIFLIVVVFVLAACGTRQHATEEYKAYSGAVKKPDQVASIFMLVKDETKDYVVDYVDWIKIGETMIDHKKYGEIKITPGTYLVEWGRIFHVSPMIKASGKEERTWSTNVILEAGHTYTIHANRTVGHGYKIYSWITDDTVDQIIWGREYIRGPYDNLLD